MADPVTILIMLVTGAIAGLAAGLFGVGGGVLMVPVLHYGLGLPFVLSTQLSLFVIAVNTPFGIWRQHKAGNVRWRTGFVLVVSGAAGVGVAILLRPWVPVAALKVVFAGVGLFAAYRMIRPLTILRRIDHGGLLVLAGLLGGAAAHWLGIGGGLIMVPAMAFLGLGMHQAVATSLLAVFSNAAVSAAWDLPVLVHHLGTAVPLALGAIVGIRGGVRLANQTAAVRLKRAFAVFLALMALYVLYDTLLV